MKTYFHGTSYENALNILRDGFLDEPDRIWTCSNDDKMYFRDADSEDAKFLCIESGKITAAYTDSNSTLIALIIMEMSDELADEIMEEDDSCENMYDSYQIDLVDLRKYILSNDIGIKIQMYADCYIPYLRPFYLTNITERYMYIEDDTLKRAINIIARSDTFIDEIYEFSDELSDEIIISKISKGDTNDDME